MKVFAAVALATSGTLGRQIVDEAVRYEQFILQARAFGLTNEEAKSVIDCEGLHDAARFTVGDVVTRAELRLQSFAETGYLPVTLSTVLTRDELREQVFSAGTILNDLHWMELSYAKHFRRMSRSRQRTIVLAAIELTAQVGGTPEGWPLERAMAVVMPFQEHA